MILPKDWRESIIAERWGEVKSGGKIKKFPALFVRGVGLFYWRFKMFIKTESPLLTSSPTSYWIVILRNASPDVFVTIL